MQKSDQGISQDRYQVIPRTLIFVVKGDQILLIKGAPTKRLWANKYNGIGGHVERGEDVLSSARRELQEEAGIQANGLRLCGTVLIDVKPDVGIGLYVFLGHYVGGELIPSEEGELSWVDIDKISELPLVDDLTTLLPKVLEMAPDSAPFAAIYTYNEQDQLVIDFGD